MILNLESIAKRLKIKTPDLITRPIGRKIYSESLQMLGNAGKGEVVVLDFTNIKVIDSSFIDEFIVKLLKDTIDNKLDVFFKLRNISKIAEINIGSVFQTYSNYNTKKIVVITDDICQDNNFYIGLLEEPEKSIINYMRINRRTDLEDLADLTGIEQEELKKNICDLLEMRILRLNGTDRYEAL